MWKEQVLTFKNETWDILTIQHCNWFFLGPLAQSCLIYTDTRKFLYGSLRERYWSLDIGWSQYCVLLFHETCIIDFSLTLIRLGVLGDKFFPLFCFSIVGSNCRQWCYISLFFMLIADFWEKSYQDLLNNLINIKNKYC